MLRTLRSICISALFINLVMSQQQLPLKYFPEVLQARECIRLCFTGTSNPGEVGFVVELGCEPAPESCICRTDTDFQSQVTSYFQSCIYTDYSDVCGDAADYTSALHIYDDYCTSVGTSSLDTESTRGPSAAAPASPITVLATATVTVTPSRSEPVQISSVVDDSSAQSSSSNPSSSSTSVVSTNKPVITPMPIPSSDFQTRATPMSTPPASSGSSNALSPPAISSDGGGGGGLTQADRVNIVVGVVVPVTCLILSTIAGYLIRERIKKRREEERHAFPVMMQFFTLCACADPRYHEEEERYEHTHVGTHTGMHAVSREESHAEKT